jgi:mannose-6-phosphate isomerase-like protein (cupin superfamily)
MDALVHRDTQSWQRIVATIKATGEHTGGTSFLSDSVIEPGFPGPPPHVHDKMRDMFFVLEGTLTMRLGDETMEAGPGALICVPPSVVHIFCNRSETAVRFLNFNTPSGWEGYMRDLGAPVLGASWARRWRVFNPVPLKPLTSSSPGEATFLEKVHCRAVPISFT